MKRSTRTKEEKKVVQINLRFFKPCLSKILLSVKELTLCFEKRKKTFSRLIFCCYSFFSGCWIILLFL
ncbi:hypothetical protein MSUIS_02620 [Mycoplasma suis KI3806]|uniref:Uncharacterized protein n=1 Tax=Mycoplasma suis (strain KI_3806) TaxID=708248 RepID=F0V3D3_MYCS3|nr:hypothetical protein MSUIS_02620 [Mycoplasma suis KI3806]